jgi:hypothetical protein
MSLFTMRPSSYCHAKLENSPTGSLFLPTVASIQNEKASKIKWQKEYGADVRSFVLQRDAPGTVILPKSCGGALTLQGFTLELSAR